MRSRRGLVREARALVALGERPGAAPLRELLPLGARAALRALRTRSAAQLRPDWVWPAWLHGQLDPTSPAYVAPGELPLAANVTARNWTMVGNPRSRREGIVDPAGLVTPWVGGWSLDWAVGRDGDWRLAARERGLRQGLVGAAPVVRTTLALGDGEAVHTAYAVPEGGERVVAEIANRSATPLAVVLAVRAHHPEGAAVIRRVAVRGSAVLVERRVALLLPEPPEAVAVSTIRGGDALLALAGGAPVPAASEAVDSAGFAHAALRYRLAPGRALRVAMPLAPRRRPGAAVALPGPEEMAARWRRELERGMRVRLPDPRLQAAVDANRAALLLFADGDEVTPGPATYHRFWFRDAAYLLLALGRWGFHAEVAAILAAYPRRQARDGRFVSQAAEWDATGAAIWAIAEHHRLTGDDALVRALAGAVRRGAGWIARARRGRGGPAGAEGLLPAGVSAEHLGPPGHYYWDDLWALRGLLDAAGLLRGLGDAAAAEGVAAEASDLRAALLRSARSAAAGTGVGAMPAGPGRGADPGMIGSLAACWPLRLLPPDDPLVARTAEAVRARSLVGEAVFHAISHGGLGTYLTMQLAQVELAAGDARAWGRLRWLLDAATRTWTWPEAVHPQLGGGCYGDGHHGWAAAEFLAFVRDVLVRESGERELSLLTLLPPEWRGRDLAVRDAPTHHGRLSYSLGWRGDRPVLRWRCEREGVRLRAPGLDPAWSVRERSGEATLGPAR